MQRCRRLSLLCCSRCPQNAGVLAAVRRVSDHSIGEGASVLFLGCGGLAQGGRARPGDRFSVCHFTHVWAFS